MESDNMMGPFVMEWYIGPLAQHHLLGYKGKLE